MQVPPSDWRPARRQLRQFAWGAALFLAVLSLPGGASHWTLSFRLAAAFLFAIGTVVPGVLRWPYMAILLIFYPFVRLFNRMLRAFSHSTDRKQNSGRKPARFQEQNEHEPATGTHG
jgi:hypothetical protein